MKTTIIFLFIFITACVTLNTFAQPVFLGRFNGAGQGTNSGNAVTADTLGNTYITGYTTGRTSGHDITTIKYNSEGAVIWYAFYNGDGNSVDEAYAIAKDASNNIYVTGACTGYGTDKDMVLIKYDQDGGCRWVRTYTSTGSHPDVSNSITIDPQGNPIIAGYSYVNSGNALTVIKYDPNGNQLWVKTGDGTSNTNAAYAVTIDNSSNIYAAGYTLAAASGSYKNFLTIKFNSAGTRQWVATSAGDCTNQDGEAYSIVNDGSGNSYITGYVITAANGKDYVTIKYNSSGAQQWLKTYNNAAANSDDISRKIILAGTEVVVTGSSKSSSAANTEDYLTIKYRCSDGAEQFVLRYDNATAHSADIAYSIAKSGTGMFYVVGSSRQSAAAGSEDIVILAITNNGVLHSTYRIPNTGVDCGNDIVTDKDGNIMIAGFLAGKPGDKVVLQNMVCAKFIAGLYSRGNMIAVNDPEAALPNSSSLKQNYPNPFNPSTTVKFDVSAASMVKIAVYDILGQEVLEPVNQFMNPGSYEVSFSLNSMASGLYFYKMTAGSFTDIKKLILTK